MTLNNNIINKINNFKIFLLDLIPIASNNTPQTDTTTGSSGSSLEYARADHVHPTDTSRASSTHTHGSISNTGTLNSDTSTVSKVVVTDGSDNIKTISKIPSANVTHQDISGKAPNNHASTTTTYGVGDASNYGHVKTINSLTQNSHSDGTALSAYQGKILNETKISHEDYLYIDTVDAEITYDDDSTDTIPILTDIREVNDILKVAIVWNDNYNENNTRPSSVSVQLLRDGTTINTYVLNSNNNWQHKVNVPFDDGQGNSYSYSWSVSVTGYYPSNITDGNLCIINMQILSVPSGPSTPT